jgi:hypothetical protein
MELFTYFFKLISSLGSEPGILTVAIAFCVGLFAVWLYSRKLDVDTIQVIGNLQSKQIQDLQGLVRALTEELIEARKEIAEISRQNTEMRRQVVTLQHMLIQNGLTLPEDAIHK